MRVFFYIASVISANVLTAEAPPLHVGPFIVPAGTLLIGLSLFLRNITQLKYGRKKTYGFISLALLLSAITSYALGDTLYIVLASSLTFALSETSETEIFTRYKASLRRRALLSGIIGDVVDSAVFVLIGLSPIGANILPWSAVPVAIVGQFVFKLAMQVIAIPFIKKEAE